MKKPRPLLGDGVNGDSQALAQRQVLISTPA